MSPNDFPRQLNARRLISCFIVLQKSYGNVRLSDWRCFRWPNLGITLRWRSIHAFYGPAWSFYTIAVRFRRSMQPTKSQTFSRYRLWIRFHRDRRWFGWQCNGKGKRKMKIWIMKFCTFSFAQNEAKKKYITLHLLCFYYIGIAIIWSTGMESSAHWSG